MTTTEKRRYSSFPKKLAGIIEPITRPVMRSKGLAGSRVLTEWESIVGVKLSQHCIPEKLSFPRGSKIGGTLTIVAENGFATELQHMQPLILERLNGYFGYQAVARLVISHSWLPPKKQQTAKPRKAALPASAVQIPENIADEELKAALKSLANTLSQEN